MNTTDVGFAIKIIIVIIIKLSIDNFLIFFIRIYYFRNIENDCRQMCLLIY